MAARGRDRPAERRGQEAPPLLEEDRLEDVLIDLADLLLKPTGLGPARGTDETFLAAVRAAAGKGGLVEDWTVEGDPREPASLHAVFASPASPPAGRTAVEPARRATVVFLHGKGGRAAEWRVDAMRALSGGYNVLVPDMRAHAPSTGERMSYGLFERVDLGLLLAEGVKRHGIDAARIGLDACSAGCLVALQYAAEEGARSLWLQSPFGTLPEMAVHYAHRATGLPHIVLSVPMRYALGKIERSGGVAIELVDPIAAARRVTCPAYVVHGENDALVPIAFAVPLFEALAGEKELWRVPRCGHCHNADEPQAIRAREYAERWTRFYARHLPAGPEAR